VRRCFREVLAVLAVEEERERRHLLLQELISIWVKPINCGLEEIFGMVTRITMFGKKANNKTF